MCFSIILACLAVLLLGVGSCWGQWFISRAGLPCGSVVKNPPANVGDAGSIPGLGRSPRGGNGNPLQYSCLEKTQGLGGAWWATVCGVANSWTRLNNSAAATSSGQLFGSRRRMYSHVLPCCRQTHLALVCLGLEVVVYNFTLLLLLSCHPKCTHRGGRGKSGTQ